MVNKISYGERNHKGNSRCFKFDSSNKTANIKNKTTFGLLAAVKPLQIDTTWSRDKSSLLNPKYLTHRTASNENIT